VAWLDWFKSATPGGAAASVAEGAVKGVLGEVGTIIKIFKLPPEQQLAFDEKMAELQVDALKTVNDAEKIAGDDRNSARQREMHVLDATPKILAYAIVGGFLAMVIALISTSMLDYPINPASMGMIGTLVGYLSAKSELVLGYYFGSSAGSAAKTDTINTLSKAVK
jgi:hypothetical protein